MLTKTSSTAYCDACLSSILNRRILCLLCVSEDYKGRQIDLCTECIESPIRTQSYAHDPSHDIMQVCRVVHGRNKPSLYESGKNAVTKSKAAWAGAQAFGARGPLCCSSCEEPITLPYWYCANCGQKCFISFIIFDILKLTK